MAKFLLLIVLVLSSVVMPVTAAAQVSGVPSATSPTASVAELPDPLTPEAVRELVVTLPSDLPVTANLPVLLWFCHMLLKTFCV